jgi:hypothetical protein
MATFQTSGGQLLRSSFTGSVFPSFPPMWSDGERWGPNGKIDRRQAVARFLRGDLPFPAGRRVGRRQARPPHRFAAVRRLQAAEQRRARGRQGRRARRADKQAAAGHVGGVAEPPDRPVAADPRQRAGREAPQRRGRAAVRAVSARLGVRVGVRADGRPGRAVGDEAVRRRADHRPRRRGPFRVGRTVRPDRRVAAREAGRHGPARGRGAAPPDGDVPQRVPSEPGGVARHAETRRRRSSTTPAPGSRRCTRGRTTRAARSSWART